MRHWIEALLDPAPIEKGNKEKVNTQIRMPPKFDVSNAAPVLLPPAAPVSTRPTRARSTRSASPSKMATPSRKIATPRKPRTTRNAVKSDIKVDESFESTTPSSALQTHIANGTTPSDSAASSVNGEVYETKEEEVKEGTFRVEIQETTETIGNVETTTTNVKLDVPHSHSELPEPEDPMKMIEEAKRMVAEAQLLDAGTSDGIIKVSKRKIEEVMDAAELAEERSSKAVKVAYTTEQKLTKEKVTRRALVGVTVMVAIGYVLSWSCRLER